MPQEVAVERHDSATKLTYADYLRFPDDGLRHEIIDGEHYVTASPTTRHQRISRNLLYLLQSYLESHPIGELFADLVIEILSPSTRSRDRDLKRSLDERAGVQEYWLVDPETERLEIFRRDGDRFGEPVSVPGGRPISTPLLPGFELPTDRVLA